MAKGYSIHIGLNLVNPAHYGGWDGRLRACEADANDMAAIARSLGYAHSTTLLTKDATSPRVISEVLRLSRTLRSGDILLLTYSGHGGQIPDLSGGDEPDNLDETWCLYDRQLLDDEIYRLIGLFQPGVRIMALSDSCHSGSVLRAQRDAGVPTGEGGNSFRSGVLRMWSIVRDRELRAYRRSSLLRRKRSRIVCASTQPPARCGRSPHRGSRHNKARGSSAGTS